MSEHFFAGLDGLPRSAKPRSSGLTMMVDWGLGPHGQEDLLTVGADYVDLAKVAVGVSTQTWCASAAEISGAKA